ncbi:prephenate dehydrogenase/arogenate dehydrogenase family protein [Melioribacteraceae bacterium 4301-Me]|uniref:prephenate dehydrogenase/arogenate dehydrogenase family protein n=1 Tax=Pyranulibacter aquaticus TaxID=3163344 RepID=UPI00359AE0C2
MEIKKISILGLGLIGGSLAKAFKNNNENSLLRGKNLSIHGFDKKEVLKKVFEEGVIDSFSEDVEDCLQADVIFLCLPVDTSLHYFRLLIEKLKDEQIISDVCGVKSIFQNVWDEKERNGFYIGGHPMTGKENGGYENSDPYLYENSIYILNENAKDYPIIDQFIKLIELTGAKIAYLTPKIHDIIVASVSHLPQLVSVSLINSASLKHSDKNFFDFAAGGFRDMTRIAASDFIIWEDIFKYNQRNIELAIDNFINDLLQMRKAINKGDFSIIHEKFENARIKRDEIPKANKGFINPLVDIFISVKDEPGVLSKITTELFKANINIKDIELLKVRDGRGGTFRLSFETNDIASKAKQIIEQIGFNAIS